MSNHPPASRRFKTTHRRPPNRRRFYNPSRSIGTAIVALALVLAAASSATAMGAGASVGLVVAWQAPAAQRIAYGDHPLQVGDLRVPEGPGPWPVAILIHGGCWIDMATLDYFNPVADAINALGIATWNIEYRPVNVEGGGWPNTFLDVAHAVDKLRELAGDNDLDLDRVITLGHSAGGHLALWAAGRPRIYDDSDIYVPDPLPVIGAVSLGGVPELRRLYDLEPNPCGMNVIDMLMGGGPRDFPDRYLAGSPFQMLPLNVPQRHLTGRNDTVVPSRLVQPYNYEASQADDSVLIVVPETDHMQIVQPTHASWVRVEEAVLELLGR